MLFSNAIRTLPGDISSNDVLIERVETTKFLGVYIDEQLNWKVHNLWKSLSRNIGVIHKLKCSYPQGVLFFLYLTRIVPYVNYGVTA